MNKFFSYCYTFARLVFGDFEPEELKKFVRLGLVFTLIIGSFWTLGTLKNATFCSMVGAARLPWAKTLTLFCMIPLLSLYNRISDYLRRDRLFYSLCAFFAVGSLIFAAILAHPTVGQAAHYDSWVRISVGYMLFIFVEAYALFMIALFWAIASDTTLPESAQRGYYLMTAFGQFGGIVAPGLITRLPRYCGFETNALAFAVCSVLIVMCWWGMRRFFIVTPAENLISYKGTNEAQIVHVESGFLEGVKLLLTNHYLLAIFGIVSFFEIIVALFDFHFQLIAATTYTGTRLAEFQGMYGSLVNFVTLLSLVGGASNIPRLLGIRVALSVMPLLMVVALLGFVQFQSIYFLLGLMVTSKALNYGINNPVIKQLYIPTTHDVRFKAQSWIEAFGYHGSKQVGSAFNMIMQPLQEKYGIVIGRSVHIMYSAYLSIALIVCWLYLSWYLGTKYTKTIKNNEVVC